MPFTPRKSCGRSFSMMNWTAQLESFLGFGTGSGSEVMKQLTLQLPGCRRVTAEEASLKRCQQAGLVWLHLTGLHPQKLLKRSERSPGDGLQEGLTRRRGR